MIQTSLFNDEFAKGSSKMPIAIHENVKLTSIERGENFVDINFENTDGALLNKRLWDPNGKYPRTKEDNTIETINEAMQREETERARHLARVLHLYKGAEFLNTLPPMEYIDFVNKVISTITPIKNTLSFNLKVTGDTNGYSTLGNFPDYLEVHIPGAPTSLKYSKWEIDNGRHISVSKVKEEKSPLGGGIF